LIASAEITVFYLFDVAEAIDLRAVSRLVGRAATQSRIAQRPSTPSYIQYSQPPVSFDGELAGVPQIEGLRIRVKAFDYGVISLALVRRTGPCPWVSFIADAQQYIENDALAQKAEDACRAIMTRLAEAFTRPRQRLLSEDYAAFVVHGLEEPRGDAWTADELLLTRGDEIALLLLGERAALSRQEKEEVLRTRISYLADDLVVPAWSAAFIYDREETAAATLEILEFANSQLLEFRYYDELLDGELARIYAALQERRWYEGLVRQRYTRAAADLHSLFIDVNELTDRTENALKFVGDVYAARLFAMVANRIALDRWKASVEDKLQTLDDIYRFVVDQTGLVRGQLLELAIVAILLFELALFFLGIMD
jgi:hypothetical protein